MEALKPAGDLLGEHKDLAQDPTFELFWEQCPRKTGKPAAEKAFEKLEKQERWAAIRGMEYHAKYNPQWRNPRLIPHPSTFLNGKRWQDEIVEDIDAKERVHASVSTGPAMGVWKAMTQMFGQPWIDKHGETPTPVWVTQLARIPEAQLSRGLRATADSVFPPSLPEFLMLCRAQPSDLPQFKALPRPYSPEEIAGPAFAELRSMLKYKL